MFRIVYEELGFWLSAGATTLALVLGFNQQWGPWMISQFAGFSPAWALVVVGATFIFALYRRVGRLQAVLEPQIIIEFDPSDGDEFYNPIGYPGRDVRCFRVGILNKSGQTVNDCHTELSDVVFADGTRPRDIHTPKFLEYQRQPQSRGQEGLPIRSGQKIYANLASFEEGDPNSQVLLRCSSPLMPLFMPRARGFYVRVSTYGDGARGSFRWFYLYVDSEGRFHCQPSANPPSGVSSSAPSSPIAPNHPSKSSLQSPRRKA